jgi:hypothetical protein
MRSIFITATLIFADVAYAQDACTRLSTAIDDSLKEISHQYASGILEDSAMRATHQSTVIGNQLQLIDLNLRLLEAAKCQVPKEPITQDAYLSAALDCHTAGMKMKMPRAGEKPSVPPECDRKTWKRK